MDITLDTAAAGIYEAVVTPDLRLRGASLRGGTMTAQITGQPYGRVVLTGTFAGPGGTTMPFEDDVGGIVAGDIVRIIALADGRINGKVKRTDSGGRSGYTN
ncbi:MAG: hypothetical protein L0H84_12755 [Pseudonocardia sp.]|nr:hypothetical protein [Pseudonocardia sp.]